MSTKTRAPRQDVKMRSHKADKALLTSEERCKLLLNSTAEAIISLDLDGRCTFCNTTSLRLLGYNDESDLLDKNLHGIIHHSYPDGTPYPFNDCKACQAFRKGEGTKVSDEVFWRKDGTSFPVEYHASPQRKNGEIIGAVVTFLDITARKQMESALYESEKRYHTLAEISPVGIFHTDAKGKFLYINERWCEITGFSREEALQKGLALGLHPEDRERVLDEWCSAVDMDLPLKSETRILHTDGTFSWVYGQVVAERNEDGELVGYVGTVTDITDRKQIEKALEERNRFVEAIMVNLPIGLAVLTADDLKIQYMNEKVEEIVGWSRAVLIDLDAFFERTIPDPVIRGRTREKVCAELASGDPARMTWEFPIVKRSGESVELLAFAIPNPECNQLIVTVQDITERKRAVESLRERNEFIETVTDNLPMGFSVLDWADRKILYQNKRLMEILGWPPDKTLDEEQFWESAIPDPNYREELRKKTYVDWESGGGRREYHITKSSGETAFLVSIDIPLREKNQFIIATLDLTDRKRAEDEVLRLNRELEARVIERTRELELAIRELEAFTYSVSHDLRAPLRAIDGFSDALLEEYGDKLDEEGKTYLRYLQEGSHEMSDLIDGLLNLSRSTRGELFVERVDLSAMANAVAEELRKAEPDRRITMRIAAGVESFADPRLLKVVMENLLGNAWKYTSKCTDACIEFGVEEQEGVTVYFVRDNGAGFDMAYADKLFLPFHRLHKTNEFPGIGIGLATVQRIIHHHGGRIWAQSTVGEGATFYFTLGGEGSTHEK